MRGQTVTAGFVTLFQSLSFVVLFGLAAASLVYTVGCAFGVFPWLTFSAAFGPYWVPQAGIYTQIMVTTIFFCFFFFLPASMRVMRLEQSHRNFQISMDDVARAYWLAHASDRAGTFKMSSEFDQVRERLAHMREHPDLEMLEPGVMEVAAQMSQQARHLADVYSDDAMMRARDFLTQRQMEAEAQKERIQEAMAAVREIQRWSKEVETEEAIVNSQLRALEEQLDAALPALEYKLTRVQDEPEIDVVADDTTKPLILTDQIVEDEEFFDEDEDAAYDTFDLYDDKADPKVVPINHRIAGE